MWPIKEKENRRLLVHIVAKSYPLWPAVQMRRYVSLININPSGMQQILFAIQIEVKNRLLRK